MILAIPKFWGLHIARVLSEVARPQFHKDGGILTYFLESLASCAGELELHFQGRRGFAVKFCVQENAWFIANYGDGPEFSQIIFETNWALAVLREFFLSSSALEIATRNLSLRLREGQTQPNFWEVRTALENFRKVLDSELHPELSRVKDAMKALIPLVGIRSLWSDLANALDAVANMAEIARTEFA